MVGFQVIGEIGKIDFEEVVVLEVEKIIVERGKLNYFLLLDIFICNFLFGVWFEDVMMGLCYFLKWNCVVIIMDVKGIQVFIFVFSVLMFGEFCVFCYEDMDKVVKWVFIGEE